MASFRSARRLVVLLFGSAGGGAGAAWAASIFQSDGKPHRQETCWPAWRAGQRTKWDDNWDWRAPHTHQIHTETKAESGGVADDAQQSSKRSPTASRHIILIRHGQYYTDAPVASARILTELGREQAELCGARLGDLGLPYTRIVTSTMPRAVETGDIIRKYLSPDLPVERCAMLKEGAPVAPEPAVGNYRPDAQKYYDDGARIEAAFRHYIHRADVDQKEDSYDVLVCHANVIRYFVCRALQLPPEAWLRISLNNGSITWLVVRPSGRVTLRALGDSMYMPTTKMSSG